MDHIYNQTDSQGNMRMDPRNHIRTDSVVVEKFSIGQAVNSVLSVMS